MKKLMIAVAAAAMVGGAFANLSDEVLSGTAYNTTISLKTTVGKAKIATTTYYLGKNIDSTAMWYEDTTVNFGDDGSPVYIADVIAADRDNNTQGYVKKFTMKKIAGKSVPCLTTAGKKDETILAMLKQLATTDKTGKNADRATYGFKSANKWCDSFSEKGEYCYRTAGTVKVSGILVDDTCCVASLANGGFVHVFGGNDITNSKKVEIYVPDVVANSPTIIDKNGDSVVAMDNLRNERDITALAIAGQGSFGAVKQNDGNGATSTLEDAKGIVSVSGYAVGTCDPVDCTSCCITAKIPQSVWDCDGTDADDDSTAAYGTFSLKYNASFTK